MQTRQDSGRCREYVEKVGGALVPKPRGRVLSAFLEQYFGKWVDYGFTSSLEEELDAISTGATPRSRLLESFWGDLTSDVTAIEDVQLSQVRF